MKEYIGLMNPKEDNSPFLDKKYKEAKVEDKLAPNTLLEMQEIANAPWNDVGGNDNNNETMTREQYISFIKEQERLEEEARLQDEATMAEPPKIEAPRMAEIGVQVDPPPENKGT